MRRVSLVVSLLFVAAGLFMMVGGYLLRLKGQYGPGPGFTAFWVGLPLALLSALWFVRLVRQPPEEATGPFQSEAGGLRRIGIIVGSLIAFGALLLPLGFNLSMLLLLLVLFFAFDRSHPLLKVVLAFAGSFGVHLLFERFLRVPLPYSSFETLRALGL